MKAFAVLLVGATLALCANGVPAPMAPSAPKFNGRSVDPFANATRISCTTDDRMMLGKNGLVDTNKRWRNFNVQADRAYNQQEQQAINDAMYNLMQVLPCISFGIWPPDSNPSGDYVYIIKGTNNGCNSYVGRLGIGKQEMNLQSPGCMGIGTIMHEMIHALGFHHEQCRPDRDDYVNILWDNIIPEYQFAFDRYGEDYVTTFGVPYNHQSIMHYRTYDFTKNGQKTITTKSGGDVGSNDQLQETDKRKLKLMYGCN